MTNRLWFWLFSVIVITGLLTYWGIERSRMSDQAEMTNRQAQENQQSAFVAYLMKKTDHRQLISLAKKLAKTDPELTALVADRAYVLAPTSRDAALLASYFHPELKEKVRQLDPLFLGN